MLAACRRRNQRFLSETSVRLRSNLKMAFCTHVPQHGDLESRWRGGGRAPCGFMRGGLRGAASTWQRAGTGRRPSLGGAATPPVERSGDFRRKRAAATCFSRAVCPCVIADRAETHTQRRGLSPGISESGHPFSRPRECGDVQMFTPRGRRPSGRPQVQTLGEILRGDTSSCRPVLR